jgi:acetyl esterase/lipase
MLGYTIQYVDRVYGFEYQDWTEQRTKIEAYQGLWLADRDDIIPENGSHKWKDYLVVYYIHGGDFCSGEFDSFLMTHARSISKFNDLMAKSLFVRKKKLIYFCLDYPKIPSRTYSDLRKATEAGLQWLKEQAGVEQIIIGSDSAGSNLAYQLLTRSKDWLSKDVIGSFFLSPWIDLSLSFASKSLMDKISNNTDFLSVPNLVIASNLIVFGIDDQTKDDHYMKQSTLISPYFQNNLRN